MKFVDQNAAAKGSAISLYSGAPVQTGTGLVACEGGREQPDKTLGQMLQGDTVESGKEKGSSGSRL